MLQTKRKNLPPKYERNKNKETLYPTNDLCTFTISTIYFKP